RWRSTVNGTPEETSSACLRRGEHVGGQVAGAQQGVRLGAEHVVVLQDPLFHHLRCRVNYASSTLPPFRVLHSGSITAPEAPSDHPAGPRGPELRGRRIPIVRSSRAVDRRRAGPHVRTLSASRPGCQPSTWESGNSATNRKENRSFF